MSQNPHPALCAPDSTNTDAMADFRSYGFSRSLPQYPEAPAKFIQQPYSAYRAPVAHMPETYSSSTQQPHSPFHPPAANMHGTHFDYMQHSPGQYGAHLTNAYGANFNYVQQPHSTYRASTESTSPEPAQKRQRLSDNSNQLLLVEESRPTQIQNHSLAPQTPACVPMANMSQAPIQHDPGSTYYVPGTPSGHSYISAPTPYTPRYLSAGNPSDYLGHNPYVSPANNASQVTTPGPSATNNFERTASPYSRQKSQTGFQNTQSKVHLAPSGTNFAQRHHASNHISVCNVGEGASPNHSSASAMVRTISSSSGYSSTPGPQSAPSRISASPASDDTIAETAPSSRSPDPSPRLYNNLRDLSDDRNQHSSPRLREMTNYAKIRKRQGSENIARDVVLHFQIGKEDAKQDLNSDFYHPYVDSTGFVYRNILLTRVNLITNTNERIFLSIYETDSRPHYYCTHMRTHSVKSKESVQLASFANYKTAFLAFRKAFKKYTRLSWEHRLVPAHYVSSSIRQWEQQQRDNLLFAKYGERRRESSRSPSPVFGDKEKKRSRKRKNSSPPPPDGGLTQEELDSCLVKAFKYSPPTDKAKGEFPQLGVKFPIIPGDEPEDGGFVLVVR